MEQPILLFPYSIDEFRGIIQSEINEAFKRYRPQASIPQSEKLLTRKECAEKLSISLVTLNDWTKRGLIQSYIIGGRVLYKDSEILASLYKTKSVKF